MNTEQLINNLLLAMYMDAGDYGLPVCDENFLEYVRNAAREYLAKHDVDEYNNPMDSPEYKKFYDNEVLKKLVHDLNMAKANIAKYRDMISIDEITVQQLEKRIRELDNAN